MSYQKLIYILILLTLVSACAPINRTDVFEVGVEPATQTGSTEAIKNEMQPIVRAMLGGIISDQIAVLRYTSTPCDTVEGLGGPPPCPDGVPEGTIVDVFPVLGPEGGFIKPEEMEGFLTNSLLKSLYAVYRVTPNPNIEPYYPEGEYAMLFERDINDISMPVILQVKDGKVVRMDFRFGVLPEDMLKEIPVENILITPQEAKIWTETVR